MPRKFFHKEIHESEDVQHQITGGLTEADLTAAGISVEAPRTKPNLTCAACCAPPTCRGKAPGENCPSGQRPTVK